MTKPYSSSTLSQSSPRADLATAPAEIVAPRRGPARCTSDTWDESSERAHPFFHFKWRQSGRVVLKVYLSMLVKRETKGTPSNVSYLFYFIFLGGGLKKKHTPINVPSFGGNAASFLWLTGKPLHSGEKEETLWKGLEGTFFEGVLTWGTWEIHCLGATLPRLGVCIAYVGRGPHMYLRTYTCK